MKTRIILISLFLVFFVISVNASEKGPVAVSPGSEKGVAVVGQNCPTFSWTAVSWTTGYKIVVFEAASTEVLTYEEMNAMVSPVLTKEIQGPALSWTPSVDERLSNGGEYVWYVQAIDVSGIGAWSEGRMFKVEVAVRLAGVEEKVRERLMEYGVDEEVITEAFEDVKSELKEVVLWGVDTQGSQGRIRIQGTEGASNTFYGQDAGASTTGVANTFIGRSAGTSNTTGFKNTFIGYYAGQTNTTGYGNTFVGREAGNSNSSGFYSTFIGFEAGYSNTTSNNTFVGYQAGYSNTTGTSNAFFGRAAGSDNTIGQYNTFMGSSTGENNVQGSSNVFIGMGAGGENTSGSSNTFLGRGAGFWNTTGNSNIFLGTQAGFNETGSNKLYIDSSNTSSPLIYGQFDSDILTVNGKLGIGTQSPGADMEVEGTGTAVKYWIERTDGATAEFVAKANNITFGSRTNHGIQFSVNSITRMHIDTNGDVGIGVTDATYPLEMGGGAYCTGTNWVDVSSREYKENITDLNAEEAFETLEGLSPVRFNYKRNTEEDYVGFIAEDVPELVAMRDRKSINTMDVVAVLTKVVQEQQKVIQGQQETNNKQQKMMQEQQRTISELIERIVKLEKEAQIER